MLRVVYAECLNVECCYVECRYAECRGANNIDNFMGATTFNVMTLRTTTKITKLSTYDDTQDNDTRC